MSIFTKKETLSIDQIIAKCEIYDDITDGVLRREYYLLDKDGQKIVLSYEISPLAERLNEVQAKKTALEQQIIANQQLIAELATEESAISTKIAEQSTPVEAPIEEPVEEINP